MAVTRTWQDFAYFLRIGHIYKIMFFDTTTRTIRTEDGYVSRKGRVGFEFEVIGAGSQYLKNSVDREL
jgi:hypothetical protein